MKTTDKHELFKKNNGHMPLWYELAHIKGIFSKILFLIYALIYRRKTSYLITLAFYEGDSYTSSKFFYKTFEVTSNWKMINFQDIWDEIDGTYDEESDEIKTYLDHPIPKTDGRWEIVMIQKLSQFQKNHLYGSGAVDNFIISGILTDSKPFCWIKDKTPELIDDIHEWSTLYRQKQWIAQQKQQKKLMNEVGGLYDDENYWER